MASGEELPAKGATVGRLDMDRLAADPSGSRPLTVGQLLRVEADVKAGRPVGEDERRQLAEAQEKIQKALHGFRDVAATVIETLRPAFAKVPEALQQFGQWQKAIYESVAPVIQGMATAFKEMPPRIQSALLAMGEQGWYLDGELGFSELWQLEALISAGKLDELDAAMTQHYEGRLEDIEEDLVKALPTRERILRSAFAAHRRGEFELSVPVLLAQSDGACLDLTGCYFFIRDRKSNLPEASLHAAQVARDAFSSAMLSPLSKVLPINASERERERVLQAKGLATWSELNRHLVLHGESTDYATRQNSLKAISLINYLVCFAGKPRGGSATPP